MAKDLAGGTQCAQPSRSAAAESTDCLTGAATTQNISCLNHTAQEILTENQWRKVECLIISQQRIAVISKSAVTLAILLAVGLPVLAAEKIDEAKFEASLAYQQGKISLVDGAVSLNLPPTYRFLGAADAQRVLTEVWGNVPDNNVLGMIIPSNMQAVADGTWGAVVMYDKNGHVDASDADTMNADQLLKEMKQQDTKDNEDRKKQGFGSATLVGWVEPPRYDKAGHKLFWAQEMAFAGDTRNVLNYNMRILGREGTLAINAVASMGQIEQIRAAMGDVAAFTNFNPEHRYADFSGSFDKIAYHDLAALVRGKAPRVGSFDKLMANLRNYNIFAIIGAIAVGVFFVVRVGVAVAKQRPGQGAS